MTTQIVSENTTAQNATGTLSSGTEATWIDDQATDTNHDGEGDSGLKVSYSGGTINYASLIGFTIPSAPPGESLVSATLYLYQTYNGGNAGTINCHALLVDFNEAQATWNDRVTSTAWTTAGARSDGNDRVAATTDTEAVPGGFNSGTGAYVSFDVTDDIGTYTEWLFEADTAAGQIDLTYSADDGTDGQRPELVLEYTAAASGGALPLINPYGSGLIST